MSFNTLRYGAVFCILAAQMFAIRDGIAQPEQLISFTSAVAYALRHNPTVRGSATSIEAAHGGVKQANSLSWPRLALEFHGARSDNPLSVFGYKLSQGNATFADFGAAQYLGPESLYIKPYGLNHPGYYTNLDTAFKLSMPLYAGGKITAQQQSARALLLAARHGNQQARNQLAYELYVAYEGFLTARQLCTIASQQVARAENFLSMSRALKQQSVTLESDILLAEAYLNHAKLGFANAQLQAEQQLDRFKTLMGAPDREFRPKAHTDLAKKHPDLTVLLSQALHYNASIRALCSKVDAEKANMLASRALYKPQVNLQLRHDWNGNTLGAGLPSDTVALGASWTLFAAGGNAGAVQTATANAKKAQFELDEQRNQLRFMLKQLIRDESQWRYTEALSHDMTQKEQAAIDKLIQRLGRGLVPLGALLESQMKLTQSKAQALQANYQLRLTRAQMLMLTNQLIPKATHQR